LKRIKPEEEIVDTDFSKYDGTKCQFLREIEIMLLKAIYPESEHGALQRLYGCEVKMTLKSKSKGVTAKTNMQTGSGTRGTTIWNTIQNAFVVYIRNREQNQSVVRAYKNIGPKYGDDSLEVGPAQGLIDVATSLQLVLTTTVNPRGGPIKYLGRLYPDPVSYLGSVPDPLRLAKKMHISFMRGDDRSVCRAKAAGFLGSDSHVPLFADFARWMMRRSRNAKVIVLDRETEFKLAQGEMPKDLPDTTLAIIAAELGSDVEHCQNFIKKCRADAKPEELEEFFIQSSLLAECVGPRVRTQ
jgi:hypothetical protein